MFFRGSGIRNRNAGNTVVLVSIVVVLLLVIVGFLVYRGQAIKKEKARIAEENRLTEEKKREQEAEKAHHMENLKKFEVFVDLFSEIDEMYNNANNLRIRAVGKSSASEKKKVVDPGIEQARAIFISINDKLGSLETIYAFVETASIPDLIRRAANTQNLACEEYIQGFTDNDQAGVDRAEEDEKLGDESYARALEFMVAAVKKHNETAKKIEHDIIYDELEGALQEMVDYYKGGKYETGKIEKFAPPEKGTTKGTGEKPEADTTTKEGKADVVKAFSGETETVKADKGEEAVKKKAVETPDEDKSSGDEDVKSPEGDKSLDEGTVKADEGVESSDTEPADAGPLEVR